MKRQAATPPATTPATPEAPKETQGPPATATKDIVYQLAFNANPDNRPLMLNTWQWNYYYQQIRGVAGPAPEAMFPDVPADQLGRRLTVDEWWAAGAPLGLAGLRARLPSRYVC
jgi:hypothetical protein